MAVANGPTSTRLPASGARVTIAGVGTIVSPAELGPESIHWGSSTSTGRIAVQPETAFARIPDTALSETDPPLLYPDYVGTRLRAPKDPLVLVPSSLSELTGPVYGNGALRESDADLTRQHGGEPLGERIVVTGRVLGADGRPLRDSSSRSGRRTRPAGTGTPSTRTTRRSTRTSRDADAA